MIEESKFHNFAFLSELHHLIAEVGFENVQNA